MKPIKKRPARSSQREIVYRCYVRTIAIWIADNQQFQAQQSVA